MKIVHEVQSGPNTVVKYNKNTNMKTNTWKPIQKSTSRHT